MTKILIFILTIILSGSFSHAQSFSKQEKELYDLIMSYRKSKGLPSIPISPSLHKVAQIHSNDLQENYVEDRLCNLHSWSNKGNWKPVCYTQSHEQAELMWSKPSELTEYDFPGYEIAFFHSDKASPGEALSSWKSSKGHHDLIINKGIWTQPWKAIGIGISQNYALVWFGFEKDPAKN
jgi:hypothetical protein